MLLADGVAAVSSAAVGGTSVESEMLKGIIGAGLPCMILAYGIYWLMKKNEKLEDRLATQDKAADDRLDAMRLQCDKEKKEYVDELKDLLRKGAGHG